MSPLVSPINFKNWIEENRELLKPPVGNKMVWEDQDYIVMVVGGPNARKDYHYNETPEFFYMVEGDMVLKVIDEGEAKDIPIQEGEIFLLPPKVPHSPQRKADTVGLVIEYKREPEMKDALEWYCESCDAPLYREEFELKNIEKDLNRIFDTFYSDSEKTTCKNCGTQMQAP